MSNISGIGSTSAVVNSDGKSTTTSSGSEWNDKFHKILTGASDSSTSGSNSDGNKTTIERTISRGTDGSMVVTLTQVTIAANGSRTSKVISQTKMGGSLDDSTNKNANNTDLLAKSQMQAIVGQNTVTADGASNEYEKNSDICIYITGATLKKEC